WILAIPGRSLARYRMSASEKPGHSFCVAEGSDANVRMAQAHQDGRTRRRRLIAAHELLAGFNRSDQLRTCGPRHQLSLRLRVVINDSAWASGADGVCLWGFVYSRRLGRW